MKKRVWIPLGLLLFAAFGFSQNSRTIRVEVAYTGKGTVDANHKIYVALWNSAQMDGGPPIDVKPLDAKNGFVTFTDVQVAPAFVNTAYDPTGHWDAQSPPPSGSSIGLYATKPPTPDPINAAPGKTTTVKITFDDSQKVQ